VEDVAVADGAGAVGARLATALAEDTRAERVARSARAARHSWDERLAEIDRALSEASG